MNWDERCEEQRKLVRDALAVLRKFAEQKDGEVMLEDSVLRVRCMANGGERERTTILLNGIEPRAAGAGIVRIAITYSDWD
jgi:hypothetical protein